MVCVITHTQTHTPPVEQNSTFPLGGLLESWP